MLTDPTKRAFRVVLAAVLCLHAALALPSVGSFPPVDYIGDESWYMDMARGILETGRPVAQMHAGSPRGEEGLVTKWVYTGLLAGAVSIFGNSVLVGRLLSFVLSLGVLALTLHFGRKLAGVRAGAAATLPLAACIVFSWHAREMRPEMMLLGFVTACCYFFYAGMDDAWKRNRYLFLAGLISTASVHVHPNGAIFAFSLLLLYPAFYRRFLLTRATVALLLGLGLGLGSWVLFVYLPFRGEALRTFDEAYIPAVFTRSPGALLRESVEFLFAFLSPSKLTWLAHKYRSSLGPSVVYLGVGFMMLSLLLGRQRRCMVFLLSLLAVPIMVSVFVTGAWAWNHSSVFLTLFFLSLGVSVHTVTERIPWARLRGFVFIAVILGVTAAGAADIWRQNVAMRAYRYGDMAARVRHAIPDEASVMGQSVYYFAFSDRPSRFMSYQFVSNCGNFGDTVRTLKPDYLLVDSVLESFSRFHCSSQFFDYSIRPYLRQEAEMVKIIEVEYPQEWAKNRLLRRVYVYRPRSDHEGT